MALEHVLAHVAHKWMERQAAVPYLAMEGRAPEPRCCCCCVSVTSGAIAVGVLQLVTYCVALLAGGVYILYVNAARHQMGDHLMAVVLATTVVFILHIVFNSLLIHGARTDTRHLVLRWVLFQGFTAAVKTVTAALLLGLLVPVSAAQWHVWAAAAGAALAVLTLEWFCFSVGLRLCLWQTRSPTKTTARLPFPEPV